MSISQRKKDKSNTRPTGTGEYAGYAAGLDTLTGGRFGKFAKEGTRTLTAEEIQATAGRRATDVNEVGTRRAQAIAELSANPDATIFQRQDAAQRGNRDVASRLDAINKETEAGIGDLAQYNNGLTSADLKLLIEAYYSGKGSVTTTKGSGGGRASYYG